MSTNNPQQTPPPNPDNKEIVVEIWKHVVDTQKHFNDIEIKIRSYALTALTFFLASMGFLEKEGLGYQVGFINIPGAALLGIAGIAVIAAFHFMDYAWYHRFLDAAVNHGIEIEKKWADILPELSSADKIKKASPIMWRGKELKSKHKINIYYRIQYCVLGVLSLALILIHSIKPDFRMVGDSDQSTQTVYIKIAQDSSAHSCAHFVQSDDSSKSNQITTLPKNTISNDSVK